MMDSAPEAGEETLARRVLRAVFTSGYRLDLNTGDFFGKQGYKLSGSIASNGYIVISVHIKGVTTSRGYQIYKHRLIAYAKYGDLIFEPGIEVRHLDNNSFNNHPTNIDIGTRSMNMLDLPEVVRRRQTWKD